MSNSTDYKEKNADQKRSILLGEMYASELCYRSLFESAKDGILILNADTGKIVDVNPYLIDLLGFSKEEFIEKSIWEIGTFQDIYENKEKFLELQQEEYVRYDDLPLVTCNGREIHVEFVSNVFLVNNSKVIQCNIRDITKRVEAEAVLEKTRKELAEIKESADELSEFTENVIDTIREPLLALDKELRVIKASRSFYKFFKVTAQETIGKHIYELGNHQWDIPKLKELLEEIIPEKNPFDNYEVEHNFATIGKRVMLLNARQVKRAFGKEKVILLAIEDITERKGKEDSLKKANRATSDSLDSLLNHMHAPMIIWDTSMIIRRFNRQFELLSGYNAAEVIDKKIDLLFPKEKVATILELLKNHSDDEMVVSEIDILTKDNQIRTVLWISSRILDEEGKKIIATISQDITSRKQTEDALSLSETRYRRLFESAKDGILMLDSETGVITDVNPYLIEMLGYSEDQFRDKVIWEIGFFKDIVANLEAFSELQQKEYVRYDDLPLETADGRKISVEFISSSYFEANKKVIQANIRDTTIRRQSELALRKSESHLSALVKTIPDLIWLKDKNGAYLSCNPMFERFFGAKEADIIGKTDYDFVDRELADFFCENDRKAIEAGKPSSNEEWVTFADDGHRAFLVTIKSPIYDSDGTVLGVLGIGRDITERKLVEQKVQASENRFRAIFDQAPIAIALIDLQGHPNISNVRLSKMLGYTKEELAEMKFTEFTYPDDIDKDLDQFADLIAGKISGYNMEKRYIHKNGSLIWANLFVTTLIDNNGQPQEIIGMVEDITEQKRIHNEIKFQADLINNVGQAVIATDLLGKVIYWNKAAENIYGWSISEAIGQNITELTPAMQTKEQANDLMKELIAGKSWAGEFQVKRKDGSSFPAFLTDTPILDANGKLEGIIGISSDITERKKSENELKESEILLTEAMIIASLGAWEYDVAKDQFTFNDQFYRLLRTTAEKEGGYIMSSSNYAHKFVHPDDISIVGTETKKALMATDPNYYSRIDHRIIYADGDMGHVTVHIRIKKDIHGNTLKTYGVNQNITERKQMELDLIVAKERAEESDRLKTAFLHNISHEIRTPMNAIVGFSGFLDDPDLEPDKRQVFIDIIIQSSDQLLSIIDDIISIASIEAGQEKIRENEFNINAICKLINEQYSQKANDKHITLSLKTDLADEGAVVISDPTKLTQILSNLIGNALKFTQKGHINFGYRVKHNQLEFYVEDSGMGIPLDMQEKIFNRFRQVETTDTRKFGGSGLGLSISKAYVEMLGGKMWLTSEVGKGSVFYFTIQHKKVKPEKLSGLPILKDFRFEFKTPKTLLIAEDEDSNFMLLAAMLSETGMTIIRAENGLEAVEFSKSNPNIDLVLMDIKMPEMDGFEATMRIKEFRPDLPIIAQTAYVTEADRMESLACGCSDYISKPINKKLLFSKIHQQLINSN